MRRSIKRDLRLRKKYEVKEVEYRTLRSLYHNTFIDSEVREIARKKVMLVGGFFTKIRNRCVVTGRSRGILKQFRVSRLTFKELASVGVLTGLKKSSW